MDPNETIKRLRSWAANRLEKADNIEGNAPDGNDAEAAEPFAALDTWLTRGGFLPEAWRFHNPFPNY